MQAHCDRRPHNGTSNGLASEKLSYLICQDYERHKDATIQQMEWC